MVKQVDTVNNFQFRNMGNEGKYSTSSLSVWKYFIKEEIHFAFFFFFFFFLKFYSKIGRKRGKEEKKKKEKKKAGLTVFFFFFFFTISFLSMCNNRGQAGEITYFPKSA